MDTIALVRLALAVISERLITILALSMSCGLACWVMWGPQWDRVATLGIFVLFSYLVIQTKERKNNERQSQVSPQE
jgi:hypothetical protein